MIIKTAMSLALAAACLATIATSPTAHAEAARRSVVVKHPPIINSGDVSASWSSRQNVIESKHYERLLETNHAFRQARMRKECGRLPMQNFAIAASRALIRLSRTSARRQRPGTTGAMPIVKVSARLYEHCRKVFERPRLLSPEI